jgi:hypothetical protein
MANNLTAVDFIEDYLKFKGLIINDKTMPQLLVGIIKEAKEMEKQQIINAWLDGVSNWDDTDDYDAKHYYEETFKK